jgi:hypothetical protein
MSAEPKDRLDAKLRRAVEDAERKDGFRYGALLHNGRECFASVSFYPSRSWWLTYRDGERVPLTKELDQQLVRLSL